MSCRFICVFLATSAICYALTEKDEYTADSELNKKQSTEDKLLATIVRARNSSKVSHLKSDEIEAYDKSLDKKPRTAPHRSESEFRDNCCGFRYGSGASGRPDPYYNRIPVDSSRYPSQYGERLPVDRYGWQTQGQPPGSSGSGGRPGGGNHVGTALHEGSQAGDRFGSRPSYGGESSRRPGGYESGPSGGYSYGSGGYGGYGSGRPTGYGGSSTSGAFGISGTLANGDEFGPMEPNYPDGNAPSHPNIQAQKAVALKALAGVALIGAAAALATNPVLLPIGIVSGRRKRSNPSVNDEDARVEYVLRVLKNNFTKVYNNGGGTRITLSPTCVARFACEIQRNYMSAPRGDVDFLKEIKELDHRPPDTISNNILNVEAVNTRVRKLIKAATAVASKRGNCNVFTCTFVKTARIKKWSILKL